MKPTMAIAVLTFLWLSQPAAAQDLRGFVTAGTVSDLNDQRFPAFGGGVAVDLGTPWVSAGAQGEVFVSWPYYAGRGGLFVQGNVLGRRAIRPFILAGFGDGEYAGPMIGAGIELRPHGHLGLRATVEDYLGRVEGFDCAAYGVSRSGCDAYLHGGQPYTFHQLTLRVGLLF